MIRLFDCLQHSRSRKKIYSELRGCVAALTFIWKVKVSNSELSKFVFVEDERLCNSIGVYLQLDQDISCDVAAPGL
jgi:hypothetical protein